MSLARAFFGAGASVVVGTLNRARDDEAGLFFSAMYRALARGVSVREAVTEAKRERIRQGSPPAAWADVVLLGDAEARPRESSPRALLLGLAGLVLGLAVVDVRRRWGRRHAGVRENRPVERSWRRRGDVASLPLARTGSGGEEATSRSPPGTPGPG